MESFCLVLTGAVIGDDEHAAMIDGLAGAFGMDAATFREKVWQRAPLIIRQSLDRATAQHQATQLASLGAAAMALPESPSLAWLLRAGRVLGPLPEPALPDLARTGDQWCHDGDSQWQAWQRPETAQPPPLPARPGEPPPLPNRPAPRKRRATGWLAGGLIVAALLAMGWRHDRPPPEPVRVVHYIPRPLQPMAGQPATGKRSCRDPGAPPGNDEDRFLVAGGQRQLTGRSTRSGDTYVAEAVLRRNAVCQPTAVQLYVFRHGAFVGTAMNAPIDPLQTLLVSFRLADDRILDYTLRHCPVGNHPCPPDDDHHAVLQPGGGGWTMDNPGAARTIPAVPMIRRPAAQ